jgi:hypothetical protein
VIVDVAEKSCCDADNERSDERTKATSSHVDLVGLKVFSSVELSRERIGNCYKTRSIYILLCTLAFKKKPESRKIRF